MSGRAMGQVYVHANFTPEGEPDGVVIEDAGYQTVSLNKAECLKVGVALISAHTGFFHKEIASHDTHPNSSDELTDSEQAHLGDWPPIKREDII